MHPIFLHPNKSGLYDIIIGTKAIPNINITELEGLAREINFALFDEAHDKDGNYIPKRKGE